MDIPTEKKVITVKPSKKKTNTDDKNAADVILFDSGKNSRLHQFIRLFFMNKSDQTVEINRIRRADRRLMDEQATAACVVTDFSVYSTAVLWLLICLLVIAAAVYCGVRTISSEEESTITVMILPVLILLSVSYLWRAYASIKRSLYRIRYHDRGFTVLYGSIVWREYAWEALRGQSLPFKYAGERIYFETDRGRVYVYLDQFGAKAFVKKVQNEYRSLHGKNIPLLKLKK